MLLLYSTSDRSFAELAFLTFQRESIPIHSSDLDPATSGLGSPLMLRQFRIYLLDPSDLPRAKQLLSEIGAHYDAPPSLPSGRGTTVAIFVVALVIAIAVALGRS